MSNVYVDPAADGTVADLETLIGLRVARIENGEYYVRVIFDNGRGLEVSGGRWEGCALGVDVIPPDGERP